MNSLLDAELGNKDVERSIKDTNNLGLPNDRSIPISEVRNKHTKEEVGRLLLSKCGRVAFAIEAISALRSTESY